VNLDGVPSQVSQTGPIPVIQVLVEGNHGQAIGLLDGYKISEIGTQVHGLIWGGLILCTN
jgi:hypothetical protein